MTALFDKGAARALEKLGRFWSLRRRQQAALLRESLHRAELKHADLKRELDELSGWAAARLEEREAQETALLEELDEVRRELIETRSKLTARSDEHRRREQAFSELQHECAQLDRKYGLVSRLLAAQPQDNPGLLRFRELLHGDFMRFANQESSLADEADAVLALFAVEKELSLVVGYPGIYDKNIVAIAGGFSSGKSEFVNSLIKGSGFRLAVGLNPVTAIPAYVTNSADTNVRAYSKSGGAVPLESEEFRSLTHEFVESFEFDLKKVMPYVAVGVPFGPDSLQHLCFIDTPGYDPAKTEGFTEEDRNTALEYAEQANGVVWALGIDVNGTVPASDIDFLREVVQKRSIKLFVVANKADLRSEDDIEDILDEVEGVLEFEDLPVCGISAYSSVTGAEVSYRGMSLFEFLSEQNRVVSIRERAVSQVRNVFEKYRVAITSDIERTKRISLGVRSMHLDVLEAGEVDLFEKMQERFDSLRAEFLVEEEEKMLRVASALEEEMVSAVETVFGAVPAPDAELSHA